MRLWLLDADVIIKFLEIDVFDKLAGLHEIHVASSVIDECPAIITALQIKTIDITTEFSYIPTIGK